jgi:hypothetical protein
MEGVVYYSIVREVLNPSASYRRVLLVPGNPHPRAVNVVLAHRVTLEDRKRETARRLGAASSA